MLSHMLKRITAVQQHAKDGNKSHYITVVTIMDAKWLLRTHQGGRIYIQRHILRFISQRKACTGSNTLLHAQLSRKIRGKDAIILPPQLTRLRNAQHLSPFQHTRHGLHLNGRGRGVALVMEPL